MPQSPKFLLAIERLSSIFKSAIRFVDEFEVPPFSRTLKKYSPQMVNGFKAKGRKDVKRPSHGRLFPSDTCQDSNTYWKDHIYTPPYQVVEPLVEN